MKETFNFRFNSTGIVHNKTLEAISELSTFPDFSLREAYYMGVKTNEEIFYNSCPEIKYPEYDEIEPYYNLIDGSETDFKKILDELVKNGLVSKPLLAEMKYSETNISKVDDSAELKIQILDYVNHFTQNDKLEEDDLIICWSVASVAMFSFAFWYDVAYNPKSKWYLLFNKPVTDTKAKSVKGKFWKIVGAVAVDCAGALVGGAVGSLLGPGGAAAVGAAVAGGASTAYNKA